MHSNDEKGNNTSLYSQNELYSIGGHLPQHMDTNDVSNTSYPFANTNAEMSGKAAPASASPEFFYDEKGGRAEGKCDDREKTNSRLPRACSDDALAKTNLSDIDKDFIESYNGGILYPELFSIIGKISRSTLYRKAKTYEESGYNYYSLIPNYTKKRQNKFVSKLTMLERFFLLKFMLHQNCYTLGRAYELISRILEAQGHQASSYGAYRKAWDWLYKNHYAAIMYARGGLKVYRDKAAPYIMRKNNVLGFGDELIGDGHTLDFMVQNPFTGKPCRAALIGFLDSASGDLAGYDIMLTENTQVIASALRNAILYMGKLPKVVHLDNGRAFKSKYFTQTPDFKTANIKGLYAKLGIQTLFSKAYNGRAKTIERFFKEFTESEAKTWSTYIGNCIDNKPAAQKRNEKFHAALAGEYIPTIQEAKAGIDMWLNEIYRKRKCKSNNGLTIAEYVSQNKGQGVEVFEIVSPYPSLHPFRHCERDFPRLCEGAKRPRQSRENQFLYTPQPWRLLQE